MNVILSTQCPGTGAGPTGRRQLFIVAIMGLMGAFFWAIRGSAGYGGSTGGGLAGLGWAVIWYGFANMDGRGNVRPYASPRIVAAIAFGVAFGGLSGYGVYISWLQGRLYLNYPEGLRTVAPWTGYAMLFLCGLHWGGITGAFMAWCAPRVGTSLNNWVVRLALGIAGALLAEYVVYRFPQWFLPFYGEGIYGNLENHTCIRALNSIRTIAPHVGLFFGFVAFEIGRRDWRAVGMMFVMALGFGVFFALGGYWHTFHGTGLRIDWWKNWEMSIGLGGGLTFGLVFLLFNQPDYRKNSRVISTTELVLGAGLPVWLGGMLNVLGGCEGFLDIHFPSRSVPQATLIFSVFIMFTGLTFLWWILQVIKTKHNGHIPGLVLIAVLVMIILLGYLVSTPLPLQLANKVLLAAYTSYIGMSLLLFILIWRNRKERLN